MLVENRIATNGPTTRSIRVISFLDSDSKHFLVKMATCKNVKIITDNNNVETIVFGNTEMNNDPLDAV